MLNTQCANAGCARTIRRAPGQDRPPLYCSFACRRSAEYTRRREAARFVGFKAGFTAMGEAEVRRQLADDADFRGQLIELTEIYLTPPDGRAAVDLDPEALALLTAPQRRFSVTSHDTPLPSDDDIDQAEASGDWAPMAWTAYKSMTWQLANGYQPDLREWF